MKKTMCSRLSFASLLVTGLAIAIVVNFASVSVVLAQTAATGAVAGTVTDQSGAVIVDATVTVTNVGNGETRTATTTAQGAYLVGLLSPGTYRLKFSAKGFKAIETPPIAVSVTLTTVLNQRLAVGSQTEVVQVTEQPQAVQTSNATIGTLFEHKAIEAMPLSTRNFTQLISLSPGVSANVNNASTFGNGTQDVNVNGGGMDQNNYMMDGVTIANYANGGAGAEVQFGGIDIPNPDAIQEFKIQTSQADASYGRNPGANVDVVTKTGTNELHGDLWEFFRNNALDANDYFLKQSQAEQGLSNKPQVLKQNQFGFTLGGPIKKDKLFFFGSYQGTRQINGVASVGYSPGVNLLPFNDPTDSTTGRDLGSSARYRAYLGSEFCPGGALAQATAGSTIPYSGSTFLPFGPQLACDGSNISSTAVTLLQSYESPGKLYIPGSGNGVIQTVDYSEPARSNEDQFLINTDYMMSSKNTFAEKYFYSNIPQTKFFDCNAAPCLDDASEAAHFIDQVASPMLTSLITNNLVNWAHITFERFSAVSTDAQSLTNCDVGITPINNCNDLITPITILGYFATNGNPTNASINAENQFILGDQVSWVHKRHTIRAGFEAERDYENFRFGGTGRGFLIIGSPADFLLGGQGNILGTAFAYRTAPGAEYHDYRSTALSGFVQDDLNLNSRLTVNLGLRWEYFGLPTDLDGHDANFFPSLARKVNTPAQLADGTLAGFVVPANYNGSLGLSDPVTGATGVFTSSNNVPALNLSHKDNFAPRVGFAWRPTASDRLVVRAGYGFFFDRGDAQNDNSLGLNYPFNVPMFRGGPAEFCGTLQSPYPSATPNLNPGCSSFYGPIGFAARTMTSDLNINYLAEHWPTPTVQEYSLDVQYELASNMVAEVGYVGSHGRHLFQTNAQMNLAQLASTNNPVNGETTNTTANALFRVPILGFDPQGLQEGANNGDSNYNSLQLMLRKQVSRLTFQAAYTFSKALGTLHPNGGEAGASVSPAGNVFDASLNINNPLVSSTHYGPLEMNHPQRFTVSYNYQLPGRTTGITGKLLGGWAVSGVTVVQGGMPITIIDSRGGSIYGAANNGPFADVSTATFAPGKGNADVATSGSVKNRLNHYFNNTAFTAPLCIVGSSTTPSAANCSVSGAGTDYGNTAVGIVLSPGQFNWDISINKETKVGGLREGARVTFRADFFNAFNHPQFGEPANDTSFPNFGVITSASVSPRIVQFAVKYIF